jgi:hypothetical protein
MLDRRSLALFRFLLGMAIAIDATFLIPEAETFFGDNGLIPRHTLLHLIPYHFGISVFLATTNVWMLRGLLGLLVCFSTCFAIGYKTFRSGTMAWVLYSSFQVCLFVFLLVFKHHLILESPFWSLIFHNVFSLFFFLLTLPSQARNPYICHGGDGFARLLLLFSLVAPVSDWLSIDALKLVSRIPLTWRQPCSSQECQTVIDVGVIGLLIQSQVIHFATGWLKMGLEWQSSYTAVHYTLHVDLAVTAFGKWFLNVCPRCKFPLFPRHHSFLSSLAFHFIFFHILLDRQYQMGNLDQKSPQLPPNSWLIKVSCCGVLWIERIVPPIIATNSSGYSSSRTVHRASSHFISLSSAFLDCFCCHFVVIIRSFCN